MQDLMDQSRLPVSARRDQRGVPIIVQMLNQLFRLLFPVTEVVGAGISGRKKWISDFHASIISQRPPVFQQSCFNIFEMTTSH